MTDELSDMQAAASARRSTGGRQKDRERQLKRTVRMKRAVALTYPAAGVVFYVLLMALWYYMDALVLAYSSLFIAGLFVGLYFWARKSLVPALITAGVVFIAASAFAIYKNPKVAMSTFGLLRYGGEGAWLVVSLIAAFQHKKLKAKLDVA